MESNPRLSLGSRLIHLGLAVFGVGAYLSAEAAESGPASAGYLFHAYLGFAVAAHLGLRFAWGLAGPRSMRFSTWSPFSRSQWAMAWEDVRGLLRLRLPERSLHDGLAGLVQSFGLVLFVVMAGTGIALHLAPGAPWIEAVEEVHELGEGLVPLFLALHVGAVVVHGLAGHPLWRNAFGFWHARRAGSR